MAALSSRTRALALALCGWTLLTWTTRVPLAWSDDELTSGGKVLATVPVLVFVVLAAVTAVAVLTRRPAAGTVVLGLAAWSVVYWAVRMAMIATHGHPVGFVVVHGVLAAVAAGLSIAAAGSVVADGAGPRAGARRPAVGRPA